MKFLKTEGDHLVFQMGRREKNLLLDLLKLYPVVPPAHHRLSSVQDQPHPAADQQLLEEALADHRAENKRQLEAMLADPARFLAKSDGIQFCLSHSQLEWLLQVLNDVRVGSWLLMGSPDEKKGKRPRLSIQNARHLWAMELAGHFQHVLLSAQPD